MEGDVKEVVGALMRVLDGGEITRPEVEDLTFDATGDLQLALNEAYIQLLEFAFDSDARRNDRKLDNEMRKGCKARLTKSSAWRTRLCRRMRKQAPDRDRAAIGPSSRSR